MNRTELINDLSSKVFVAHVGDSDFLQDDGLGSKLYRVSFREIVGKLMTNRSINFYVLNDGTADEKAYYQVSEPVQSIGV